MAARRHTVEVDVDRDLASSGGVPLHVLADPTRLHQVLTNLLSNAAKFTDPGGRITVRARALPSLVELTVEDSGRGIAPELLPRIFDAFVQGPQGIDRPDGGLGLGLAIVRLLVEQQGGKVAAASAGEGRGARFTVTLPRAAAAAVPTAIAAREPSGPTPAAPSAARVLVVDDNRDAADLLAEALGIAGHEVRVAYDAQAALALARSDGEGEAPAPFDAAVIDIGLPDIDGFELARRLRAERPHPPMRLLALTGYGDDATRRAARAAGFDGFLVKPVDLDALMASLADRGPATLAPWR